MSRIGKKPIILPPQAEIKIEKGKVLAQIPQWDKGTLYQRKDFNAEAVLRAKRNMMDGMIEDYVETLKAKKAPKIQLIELK